MKNKEEIIQLIDQNSSDIEHQIQQSFDIWFNHVLFSNLWWLGVALSIFPWIIWFTFMRKRQSTDRLLYVGLFVMVISLVLDLIGDQLGLWRYRFQVIPFLPSFLPWDMSLMPLSIMVLIQYKPKFNPYIKAAIFAFLTSYVGEPIARWLGIYDPVHWRSIYSLPIQFMIYILAHYISRRNQFERLEKG